MIHADEPQTLEPVHADEGEGEDKRWASWLVLFLRVMAVASIVKGLYHWAVICGINAPFPSGFDSYSPPYQVATVFFAVIDPASESGLARGAMGRRGVAHVRHFDGRGGGLIPPNLWREHIGCRVRARPARHICVAGRDGCARTAGVTELRSAMGEKTAMATIGFIGLGNMGLPMAQNLVKAGHSVCGFDLSEYASERLAAGSGTRANSIPEACSGAEVVITMCPRASRYDRFIWASRSDRDCSCRYLADRILND
jgi:hypothetical protein